MDRPVPGSTRCEFAQVRVDGAAGPLRRINVRGVTGAGKSTFAAALASRLGLAYFELDALHHGPNWAEPTAAAFRSRVSAALASAPDGWVVDGNYDSKLGGLVLDAADVVVWLDPPLGVVLVRLLRRTWHRVVHHVELWNGNHETWGTAFFSHDALIFWAVKAYYRHRREWPARLAAHPRVVRLRTEAAKRRWMQHATAAERP